jgi:hypothetical protein
LALRLEAIWTSPNSLGAKSAPRHRLITASSPRCTDTANPLIFSAMRGGNSRKIKINTFDA